MYRSKEGFDVTGIVSVICSRHGFFLPEGTVDMQKGERYLITISVLSCNGLFWHRFANADYALAGALKGATALKRIVVSYDIGCGYAVNFKKRFKNSEQFHHLLPLLDKITFLIGKLHLVGHKEACQILYSFNYTPGVGRTDGEAAERVWAQANENIVSTREMTQGHRHDVLNDQHSALNFDKYVNTSMFII